MVFNIFKHYDFKKNLFLLSENTSANACELARTEKENRPYRRLCRFCVVFRFGWREKGRLIFRRPVG